MSRVLASLTAAFAAALLAPTGALAAQPPAPAPDLSAPLLRAAPTGPTTLPTNWACHPDRLPNPCSDDGATTVLSTTSRELTPVVDHVDAAPSDAATDGSAAPPVDCFYVYPTATAASGTNAPRRLEQSVEDVLRWQTTRFGRTCRMFAPIYRQVTSLGSIGVSMFFGQTRASAAQNVAFSDVLGAWRDYLAHDNHGRGVLLIGHSQGAAMLMRLMEREVDRTAEGRARLVGAFLIGSNVAIKRGQRLGGNFAYVPTCSQPGEYGCIVAYSAFTAPPGNFALFGRLGPLNKAFGGPYGAAYVPACTNPAALSGDGDVLRPVLRGTVPAGAEGRTDRRFWNGRRPEAATAWVVPADRFTATCRETRSTAALMVRAGEGTKLPASVPWADWGLHAREMQLTMGNLERIAALQSAAWLADHPS